MPFAVQSYAKVNYTLDVLSRRDDGYHSIASVMQTVSLADTIELDDAPPPGIVFECDAPGVPNDATNLAYRAATLALEAAGCPRGLRIRLTKRVPSQAGLGGGSSNAAATLRAVSAYLDLRLEGRMLHDLAARLGSDVPFFLTGGTAACRGRGEEVSPLPDGPPLWLVIVKPTVGVSTGAAYAAMDADAGRVSARATRSMEQVLAEGDPAAVTARMVNDFEAVVLDQHPEIALLLDELTMARARCARLCGSGAAVFGVAASEADAGRIAASMRLKYDQVHVCRTVPRDEALRLEGGAR